MKGVKILDNEITVKTICKGIQYNVKIGDKFNHLTVVSLYRDIQSSGYKRWFCDCVCDCEGKLFKDKKGVGYMGLIISGI